MADKPDRLVVSLDLALPISTDADPMEYVALYDQVVHTLRQVYGIEVKYVAGTVSESQYDMVDATPDDGGEPDHEVPDSGEPPDPIVYEQPEA